MNMKEEVEIAKILLIIAFFLSVLVIIGVLWLLTSANSANILGKDIILTMVLLYVLCINILELVYIKKVYGMIETGNYTSACKNIIIATVLALATGNLLNIFFLVISYFLISELKNPPSEEKSENKTATEVKGA